MRPCPRARRRQPAAAIGGDPDARSADPCDHAIGMDTAASGPLVAVDAASRRAPSGWAGARSTRWGRSPVARPTSRCSIRRSASGCARRSSGSAPARRWSTRHAGTAPRGRRSGTRRPLRARADGARGRAGRPRRRLGAEPLRVGRRSSTRRPGSARSSSTSTRPTRPPSWSTRSTRPACRACCCLAHGFRQTDYGELLAERARPLPGAARRARARRATGSRCSRRATSER